MNRWLILTLALLTLGAVAPAVADDRADCVQEARRDLAVRACTALIKSGRESQNLADAYYNRGVAYYAKGDYVRAIADYDKAIQLKPDNPGNADAYYNRGVAYYAKGDYVRAIADYDKAIQLKPDNPGNAAAYYNRGLAYAQQGDYVRAIADYDKAIQLKPNYGYAYYARGLAYRTKSENAPEALSDFRAAAHLIPATDPWNAQLVAGIAEIAKKLAEPNIFDQFDAKPVLVGPTIEAAKGLGATASATDTEATVANNPVAGRRVALVIGNSRYANGSLTNPRNDAELMTRTLHSIGFEVTELIDADQKTMMRAILDFGDKLHNDADASLFYYAGHGVQVAGENYLIPVDAEIDDEREVKIQSINVNAFLSVMEGSASKINIVVLDACRNNPYAQTFRSQSRGLAAIVDAAPIGTYIAFSTAPGKVAADGDEGNSPYTKALAAAIVVPGRKIEDAFKKAREIVMAETNRAQVPWETTSIVGDFYFVPAR